MPTDTPIPTNTPTPTATPTPTPYVTGGNPAIEQQIDIQSTVQNTTSTSYTDTNGTGSFLWNSQRYSSLQHVYFEAGIVKSGAIGQTKRIRSNDILSSLMDGTVYKPQVKYACTNNSGSNTFTETGYAELWTADNATEVTASAVSSTINTGTGPCPGTPATVAVRNSRLIILQSDPNIITDTDTYINIGSNFNQTPTDIADHAPVNPKIWLYTDHSLHVTGGWDSIKAASFSATFASGTNGKRCLPASMTLLPRVK